MGNTSTHKALLLLACIRCLLREIRIRIAAGSHCKGVVCMDTNLRVKLVSEKKVMQRYWMYMPAYLSISGDCL